MTPTLERHYQQALALTVLSSELHGDSYLREVVLSLAGDHRRVEYGVIRIFLGNFPPRGRRRVLEEQTPLGGILHSEGIPHLSWPQAFFRTHSDTRMSAVLGLRLPGELFGRRNVLLDGSRRLLAEVIEVLAPVERARVESERVEPPDSKSRPPERYPNHGQDPKANGSI